MKGLQVRPSAGVPGGCIVIPGLPYSALGARPPLLGGGTDCGEGILV